MIRNILNLTVCSLILVATSNRVVADSPSPLVSVIVGANATQPEITAAGELAEHLRLLYPDTSFRVVRGEAESGGAIYVGTLDTLPELKALLGSRKPSGPEGYLVTTASVEGRECGAIIGTDPAGVAYGVYGLLKRLGCGFYLSLDTPVQPKDAPFSFDGWARSDQPLVPTRMVFNWHNFLSGCSTWRVEDWKSWIRQSQKMGYNTIMVHAYGNNPMAGFAFRGRQKPVGYLSSTRIGRDWATNHVNDVRRLFGGDAFDQPVFGCEASIDGTDLQRTEAAQSLMSPVFEEAERRGVRVYFAVDVDTTSANPPALIELLDEDERFQTGGRWLVRPDTPGGYAYYRAQVEELLRVYPQLDCLVVWHRTGNTPWMSYQPEEMPQAWQDEYSRLCQADAGREQLWHSVHIFGQAKIVAAFQRAVAELGRPDMKIAFGSWQFSFMPAADRFLPSNVELIGLDYAVLHGQSIFDLEDRRADLARIAAHRSVIPVAWAQHDDGNYVGRPYTPYPDFYDKLDDMGCADSGYGIIHWTTWPLDLYFESLVRQVWRGSKNESLQATCQRMARNLMGGEQADAMAEYLEDWVTSMQKVGRETGNYFSEKPFKHPDELLAELPEVRLKYERRMTRLNEIDAATLSADARGHVRYFRGLERFILALYENDRHWILATRALNAGKLAEAREHLAKADPEAVIRDFADFSAANGMTRGEQGLIVTMNTRWLPYFVQLRQRLGVEAVRYNFAATSHDPLAQSPGSATYLFDASGAIWQTRGEKETGLQVYRPRLNAEPDDPLDRDVFSAGIKSQEHFELSLGAILSSTRDAKAALPAGDYKLELWCASSSDLADGQAFRVTATEAPATPAIKSPAIYRLKPTAGRWLRIVCNGNSTNNWNSFYEIRCAALQSSDRPTASGQAPGTSPEFAIDGKSTTRWAAQGDDQWLQVGLDPDRRFEQVEIDWYEAASRLYDCGFAVSSDGESWTKLTVIDGDSNTRRMKSTPSQLMTDTIELRPGQSTARHYKVTLGVPSIVQLRFEPTSGEAVVNGVRLSPICP